MGNPPLRFFVIGAGRAGTTSLCQWLGSLPGVVVSDPKETNFFCRDELYRNGSAWYERLAPARDDTIAIGEGSVLYSHRSSCPQTAERIRATYPDARIVYVVRNPLWQVLSSWRYGYLSSHHALPFSEAVRRDPSYLERCDYAWQLEPYQNTFAPRQIHLTFFEDFLTKPDEFLRRLIEFLGVAVPADHPGPEKLNSTEATLRPARLLQRLRQRPEFLRLRQLVPPALRQAASRSLSERAPLPADQFWTPGTHAWFVAQTGERTRDFLRKHGKPAGYWDLSLPSLEHAS
jgi:hypothetical protein